MTHARGAVARVRPWLPWGAVAGAAGVAAVAGSYLAVGRRPAFVGDPLGGFVLAASPDALVTFAITGLGDVGHLLAIAAALGLACLLLGVTALPGVLALRNGRVTAAFVLAVALPAATTLAVTLSLPSAVGAGLGAGLTVGAAALVAGIDRDAAETSPVGSRRRVLGAVGSAIGLGALGVLVRGAGGSTGSFVEVPDDARPAVRDHLTRARRQSFDVEGLEPLVSTDFYEVDINSVANPAVDRDDWTLTVTGAVEREVEFDFDDVTSMPLEDRFVTLRCVGDHLNGRKMDNALWSGVPMERILEPAGPIGDRVVLSAADGYFNDFPIEALWPGLLAYRMNGRPLPRAHGAPARALVPGHWGEINVKWLTEIEVTEQDSPGYWELRGWNGTGPVHTVAKLWQDNHLGDGRMEVAGHAYAGTRGIRAVEVSTDGGETWTEAQLSEPLPGDDVWRQWRHEFTADGPREVVVRAVDGTGDVQIPERGGPSPSGATGWVSKTVRPR